MVCANNGKRFEVGWKASSPASPSSPKNDLSKKSKAEIVEIEIYDQRYPLRLNTPAERSEVLKVAEQVDLRMRAIAQQSGTVDSLKVAILTALHLAQEQREQSEGDRSLEKAVASGSQKWIRELDNVISCP